MAENAWALWADELPEQEASEDGEAFDALSEYDCCPWCGQALNAEGKYDIYGMNEEGDEPFIEPVWPYTLDELDGEDYFAFDDGHGDMAEDGVLNGDSLSRPDQASLTEIYGLLDELSARLSGIDIKESAALAKLVEATGGLLEMAEFGAVYQQQTACLTGVRRKSDGGAEALPSFSHTVLFVCAAFLNILRLSVRMQHRKSDGIPQAPSVGSPPGCPLHHRRCP